jgi:CPA1 family monovalent cation:H+ antiporter
VGHERDLLIVATYVVVVFSIVVQGLTISRLLRRLGLEAASPAADEARPVTS